MNVVTILVLMLFMHIVDDFYLQGVLARMKQRDWWYSEQANLPLAKERDKCKELHGLRNIKQMYEKDYIIALIMHAFSWSVSITLPIFFSVNWNPHWAFYLMILANCIIHFIVDDLKANKKKAKFSTGPMYPYFTGINNLDNLGSCMSLDI